MESNTSSRGILFIDGRIKKVTNYLCIFIFTGYMIALSLFFYPTNTLNISLWAFCAFYLLLILHYPDWWLWVVIVSLCTLGFIPNLYGVFNKDFLDGSILSISHLQLGQVSGMKGRMISFPLLGLPPSLFIWWVTKKKVLLPKPFIPIAVFCALMLVSSILVCLRYINISVFPFDISFVTPDFLGQLPAARKWWQSGMPYTLMAFTIVLTFANLLGGMILIAVFNQAMGNKRLLRLFSSALIVSTIMSVCYGLAQMKGFVPAFTPDGRFESTFQNQGSYGIFVGISCAFFFNRVFLMEKKNLLNVVLLIISILGLFINKSRTAYIALIINPVVVYIGYLMIHHYTGIRILSFRKHISLVFIIVAILGSVYFMSVPKFSSVIIDNSKNPFIIRTAESFNTDKGGLVEALSGRLDVWEKTLDVWKEDPIWGCGQGQLYWKLRSLGADDTAASQFLLVLGEMGIVGFLLLLWIVASLGRDLASPLLMKEIGVDHVYWLLLSTIIVNLFIQSFTIHILHFLELPLLLGIIIAMGLASSYGTHDPYQDDMDYQPS